MKQEQFLALNENWQVAQYPCDAPERTEPTGDMEFIPATVPGAVQYDLVAAGKMENPYESTKTAFASAWAAKSDWLYRNIFTVDKPEGGRWFLHVDGVDTYCEVWLNGTLLGETRNNYRFYRFPVDTSLLLRGENVLGIRVKAHHRMAEPMIEDAARLGHESDSIEGGMGKSLIRRYQRSFFGGSSLLALGTGVLGIGINRPVSLYRYDDVRIEDFWFRTVSVDGEKAECAVHLKTEGADADVTVRITDPVTGLDAAVVSGKTENGDFCGTFSIEQPKLWWPAGYGEAFLYRATAEIKQSGDVLCRETLNAGIKTVRLIERLPSGRDTFYFEVNGKKVWVRGQNTIPLDYIKVYGNGDETERLFVLLKNAGTNLIRVWGGGMPVEEDFCDACDRLGIMLWAEGFLHSNVYPDYDERFVGEYREECREMLIRVRRHASLSMVCGGNEQIEGWEEYGWQEKIDRFYGQSLFTEVMPALANELCPEIPYIENSPHGGADCQSPVKGECHNWGNYYNSFKDPLFVSETCWSQESYSRPETLEKYMGIRVDDFAGQGWIDRWIAHTSRPRIGRLAYSNWLHRKNPSLRRYLHTLELEQARADYSALRQFRFRSPSNNGVIYWSFNKGGPLFQFGCVDYGGYPLMSYYVVSRLYKRVAVGLFRDGDEISAIVSNQSGVRFSGSLEILHVKGGELLSSWQAPVEQNEDGNKKVFFSDNIYGGIVDRTREVLFARLTADDGCVIDEDILYFCPFAEYLQEGVNMEYQITQTGKDAWELTLKSNCAVRQLEIESNHKILCDDNYFPMAPGKEKKVVVTVLERTGKDAPTLILKTPDETYNIALTLDTIDVKYSQRGV